MLHHSLTPPSPTLASFHACTPNLHRISALTTISYYILQRVSALIYIIYSVLPPKSLTICCRLTLHPCHLLNYNPRNTYNTNTTLLFHEEKSIILILLPLVSHKGKQSCVNNAVLPSLPHLTKLQPSNYIA